jgi:SAM-dependent methyltransferase
MSNRRPVSQHPSHLRITEPSPWVRRFAPLIRNGGTVLDLACGGGRHARYFLALGYPVAMVDRDCGPVGDLAGRRGAEIIEADLEGDAPWPLAERTFAAVVVVNYLHRPLLPRLIGSLEDDGVLIYETFARGNERFSRPRNPDHLLKSGELLEAVRGKLQVIAYEHGIDERAPLPGVKQRLCAINAASSPDRNDGEAEPRPIFPI